MKLRYEIKDREHPTWKGQRFTELARARTELTHAVPATRFYIWDRQTKRAVGE